MSGARPEQEANGPRCGFIGLGAMGAPMARHLAQAGLLAGVANRSHGKALLLAEELGVDAFAEPGELARHCDVVLLCVTADSDVLGLVRVLGPFLRPGAVVVDHSTVAAGTARAAAEELEQHRVRFLDAPVSGGVEGAVNGRLSIMAGGDPDALERARPALDSYGKRITHMGGVGNGQATKAVNQVLVAGIAQAVCEGLALGEALGLDPERLLPTLGAGAAGNWFLEKRGASMLRDQFSVGFKLALLHKDLGIVRGMALAAGIRDTVIEQSLADYAELMARGHGEEDISALIRLKRQGTTP